MCQVTGTMLCQATQMRGRRSPPDPRLGFPDPTPPSVCRLCSGCRCAVGHKGGIESAPPPAELRVDRQVHAKFTHGHVHSSHGKPATWWKEEGILSHENSSYVRRAGSVGDPN